LKNNALLILECLLRILRILKRHPVFGDIVQVLAIVPFKIRRFNDLNVLQTATFVNGEIPLDIPTIPTSIFQAGSSPHISFDIPMDSQHYIHE